MDVLRKYPRVGMCYECCELKGMNTECKYVQIVSNENLLMVYDYYDRSLLEWNVRGDHMKWHRLLLEEDM